MSASNTSSTWSEQTSPELAAVAAQAVLILPIGATEQHGPHLPVGVDAMVAEHIAHSAADRAGSPSRPVLVAPTLSFGSSHHHLPRAGTLSLTSATLYMVLMDLLRSGVETGLRRFLILNGHGGNDDVVRQAARDITTAHDVIAAAASYWSLARADLQASAASFDLHQVPGHAGAFETSLILARWPHLARQPLPSRKADHDQQGRPLGDVVVERHSWVHRLPGGFTDSPDSARARAGQEILNLVVQGCTELLRELATIEADHG